MTMVPAGTLGTLSLTDLSSEDGETHTFGVDTSFKPYRREAHRRRTIEPQRDAIDLTNIPGEGTLATEGVWRREMRDFSLGAGQFSLDRKGDDNPGRFYSSKGLDIFTYPQRATLLPDTYQAISIASVLSDGDDVPNSILLTRCGDYIVTAAGGGVNVYNSAYEYVSTWGWNLQYGGTGWTTIYSMCSNDTFVYIATDTGLWFSEIPEEFSLYAAPDATTPYNTGYTMVRWANDQLVASCGARLYAFQPRVAPSASASVAPFGSPPSVVSPGAVGATITLIVAGPTATAVVTQSPHGLEAGQLFAISGSNSYANINSSPGLSNGVMSVTTVNPHGFVQGQRVTVHLYYGAAPGGRTETINILSVVSPTGFTYNTTKFGAAIIATGFLSGWVQATGGTNGYNTNWNVATVTNSTTFTIVANENTYGALAYGGSISAPAQNGTYAPDVLVTHENPNWVWSDATGGQTQVYFTGYVQAASGNRYAGSVLRSDLLGSSTSQASGIQVIASSSVAQPWMLDTPVQCLPLSQDEFPTCIEAYLNYIFVGTNRGIRMCQTLSIYDPTATATGDLKSGPLIPNLLQPVTLPVTAITGDGRFVWFAWNNYDGSSTGLGKLNLQEFIPGDDLAPVYASDLMVTGQGIINSLDWDPVNNVPIIAIAGLGVYVPYATNEGGNLIATQYVPSATLNSSYYDFGIAEDKIPVFFDYGVYLPSGGGNANANVIMEPLSPSPITIAVPEYSSNSQAAQQTITQTGGAPDRATQFQTVLTIATSDLAETPVLVRWTMKAWPTPVQGTEISAVINVSTVVTLDGADFPLDPDVEYAWLESLLRWDQHLVLYQEGQISAVCVIDAIDDIPDQDRGTYEGGFQGDFVLTLKTLTPFVYTPAATT